MEKRLVRVRNESILGGVCAGFARYLGWDLTMTRVFYALLTFFSAAFPGTLVYILLWIFMPKE